MRVFANPLFQYQALSIYLLTFVTALVASLVLPTFSLFLESQFKVRPFLVGLPFVGIALASIFFNYLVGSWSDTVKDRRPLIACFCLLGVVACAVFAMVRNYWIVSLVAVFIFSLSMVSFSQILAYSLDYANRAIPVEKIPLFNSIVRAQIALAWVGGPPLGFYLVTYWSFFHAYAFAATIYLILVWMSLKCLALLNRQELDSGLENNLIISSITTETRWALLFAVAGFSLLFGVNNAYLISLPLYLKNDLQIGAEWMGPLMGLAAGLEIPFMLLAGHLAARTSMLQLIFFAAVSAMLLYAGVYISNSLWQFFALQIFNAVFIGILAGLGVSVIQQLLPNQSGIASSLYTNTTHIGNLFSSLMVAIVADYFGYHSVFLVNLLFVVMAIWVFSRIKNLSHA